MEYLEKIEKLKLLLSIRPELTIYFDYEVSGMSSDSIEWITYSFPYVAKEYIEFLKKFDGMQLEMFVLWGSEKSRFPHIKERLAIWEKKINFKEYMPFGEDASGDSFLINVEGKVFIADIKGPTKISYLSENFASLVNEIFLGEQYLSYYKFGNGVEDWLNILREQNWCK
jgi:SMI1-KNR4 cell-wall